MFSFDGGKQLERLASCQPRALDSVLNWPCSAHHRRTAAYKDAGMTRDMSPDWKERGKSSLMLPPACHFLCFVAFFNFRVLCFLSADEA